MIREAGVPDPHGRATEESTEEWNRRYHELPEGVSRPTIVAALADGDDPHLAWYNELGGQTWRIGPRYLKWSPDAAGIDLEREIVRLRWLEGRHPAPVPLDDGRSDGGRWMLTAAIEADSAVSDHWRGHPERAVRAVAEGLRRMHALPIDAVPADWESWATRQPPSAGPRPPIEDPVVVHGDACAPNTLLDADGIFAASVDVGDLAVADRWADLAVASMSLEWNYGPGWDGLFWDAYGIRPDPERIAWYRALWEAES